jgi:hypothetical protein
VDVVKTIKEILRAGPININGQKFGKRPDLFFHAHIFKCRHIRIAFTSRDDGPRISRKRHHHVDEESPDALISDCVGMSMDKNEMSKNHSNCRNFVRFCSAKCNAENDIVIADQNRTAAAPGERLRLNRVDDSSGSLSRVRQHAQS